MSIQDKAFILFDDERLEQVKAYVEILKEKELDKDYEPRKRDIMLYDADNDTRVVYSVSELQEKVDDLEKDMKNLQEKVDILTQNMKYLKEWLLVKFGYSK